MVPRRLGESTPHWTLLLDEESPPHRTLLQDEEEWEDEDADMGYQEHGDNHSTTERADEEETEEEGEEEEPEQPPPRQAGDRGRRGPQPGNATWLPEAWQPPTQH